jgi:hypothetical protein
MPVNLIFTEDEIRSVLNWLAQRAVRTSVWQSPGDLVVKNGAHLKTKDSVKRLSHSQRYRHASTRHLLCRMSFRAGRLKYSRGGEGGRPKTD